jgi:hypothetical protein
LNAEHAESAEHAEDFPLLFGERVREASHADVNISKQKKKTKKQLEKGAITSGGAFRVFRQFRVFRVQIFVRVASRAAVRSRSVR